MFVKTLNDKVKFNISSLSKMKLSYIWSWKKPGIFYDFWVLLMQYISFQALTITYLHSYSIETSPTISSSSDKNNVKTVIKMYVHKNVEFLITCEFNNCHNKCHT